MDTTWSADEIFNDKLANLGNEAKRRLIELLAASLTFSDSKQDDDRLFDEICGSWAVFIFSKINTELPNTLKL